MKDHDNGGCGCFLYILLIIIIMAISYIIFGAVWNSDLPEWVKYWLLF